MDRRLLAIALAALGAAACSDNRVTVEIKGRAAPQDVTSCKFAATGDFQAGPGLIDVAKTVPHYAAMLYIRNNAADPSVKSPGSVTDSLAWRASAIKVRLNPSDYISDYPPDPALLSLQLENTLPADGQTIAPDTNGVQFVDLVGDTMGLALKAAVAAGARSHVVLGVTILGATLDGTKVDTGEWFFGLDVCNGCQIATCTAPAVLQTGCFGAYQDPTTSCK